MRAESIKDYGILMDAISTPAFIINRDHKVVAWNSACALLTGIDAEAVIGTDHHWSAFYALHRPCLADLVVDSVTEQIALHYEQHGKAKFAFDAYEAEGWFANLNGKRRYLMFEARPLLAGGRVIGAVEMLQDITEHKDTSDKLKLALSVFENTGEGIMVTNSADRIVSINRAFTAITGYGDELIGESPAVLASDRHSDEFYRKIRTSLREFGYWCGEIWNRRKNGEEYLARMQVTALTDDDEVNNYVTLFSDITKHKEAEDRITFMAHHDFLTGLPNRILLEDRISQLVARQSRSGEGFAVAFLDLDKFKLINDALGHDVGDKLLKEVAARLSASVRATDTVSRQGGDEFVLLLAGLQEVHDITQVAIKLIAKLNEPYHLDGHRLSITPSVGISIYPTDGATAAELIKSADMAMYHAKSRGRNNFQFFTQDMNVKVFELLMLESSLRAAIPDQLFIEFQPQLNLVTQAAQGCEALVRWRHPTMGVIGPDKFIPLAESSGLIHEIGGWVLEQSCRFIRQTGTKVAVNLSPVQLSQKDIVAVIAEAAKDVDNGMLTLEITEGAFINEFESTKKKLEEIKALGITIALDDFGTGYSSLSYLRKLPIDYIKIDKSFVWDNQARSIVQAIIGLADTLGMATIAEGVETPEQMAFLERHGCGAVQGFYSSRPLDEPSLLAFMEAHAAPKPAIESGARAAEPLLGWSFTFSTGIAAIDRQHKDLIDIINRLHVNARNPEMTRRSIDDLVAYTKYHFDFEAGLMARFKIGGAAGHLGEHDAFVDKVRVFATSLECEPTTALSNKVTSYLASWLTNHILAADRRLGQELIDAGYCE